MIQIKNGIMVPYIYFIVLSITGNLLLSTAVAIRLFTINFFYWFCDWSIQGQLKQMVRFTDSQTVMCVLYVLFNKHPVIARLAYSILFLVTFGFWIVKIIGIDEILEKKPYPFFQSEINQLYHYINHGLLFLIMSVDEPAPFNGYNNDSLNKTLQYILFYLMIIYIPWYFITGDKVYDI